MSVHNYLPDDAYHKENQRGHPDTTSRLLWRKTFDMDNHNNDRQPDRLAQDLVLEVVLLPQSRQETMEKPFTGTS